MLREYWYVHELLAVTEGEARRFNFKLPAHFKRCTGFAVVSAANKAAQNAADISLRFNSKRDFPIYAAVHNVLPSAALRHAVPIQTVDVCLEPNQAVHGVLFDRAQLAPAYPAKYKVILKCLIEDGK